VCCCRVGDITLGEFKNAIKKHGNYRFIFKALDPELGTVKEEVGAKTSCHDCVLTYGVDDVMQCRFSTTMTSYPAGKEK